MWGKFGRYLSGNEIKGMSGSGQTEGKEHKERMAKRTLDGVERPKLTPKGGRGEYNCPLLPNGE